MWVSMSLLSLPLVRELPPPDGLARSIYLKHLVFCRYL